MRTPWIAVALAGSLLLPAAWAQKEERAELLYRAAIHKETVDGDLKGAIDQYRKVVARAGANRALAAQALMGIGQCFEKLGDLQARVTYERVVRNFADQSAIVAQARSRLAALSRPRTAGPPAVSFRQVWVIGDPAWSPSPDGRYVSFSEFKESGGDLAIRDLVTGQNRRLTDRNKAPADQDWVAWTSVFSPDGRQLAYLWMNGLTSEIRLIGVDGAGQRTLLPARDNLSLHDWSADGLWLLAAINNEVLLVSLQDGRARTVRSADLDGSRMMLSPDGRFVLYAARAPSSNLSTEIRLLSTDGARDIRLVEDAVHDVPLGWAGNGRFALFASDRSGSVDFWVQEIADGLPVGAPRIFKRDAGRMSPMGVTRGTLFYELNTTFADVYTAAVDLPSGRLLRSPQLAGHRFITENRYPHWSPDGKYLLYASERPMGEKTLVIQDADSGQEREIRPVLKDFIRQSWRPDGAITVIGTAPDNRRGLFLIDPQSGDVSLVLERGRIPGAQSDMVWSKDCQTVWAYSGEEVHRLNLRTGSLSRVFSAQRTGQLSTALLSVSPDESTLVFQSRFPAEKQAVLMTIPSSGGTAREFLRIPWDERFSCCRPLSWTADGKYVLGARNDGSVWLAPVDGGSPVKTELSMSGLRHPHLHPDGRRIAFIAGESHGEIWVMENFLPVIESMFKAAR